MNQQTLLKENFYERLCQDLKTSLVHVISEAGSGKTNLVRKTIEHAKIHHPELKFVIIDPSQAHYHNSPLPIRQRVNPNTLRQGMISNEYDCVYDVSQLNETGRRQFTGEILKQHFRQRIEAGFNGDLDKFPNIVFVLEECDCYFGSYSLRLNDEYATIFQDFISVSRNYSMRALLISVSSVGSVSPSLRRRTRRIYGKLISESDIHEARRMGNKLDLTTIPRYSFAYENQVYKTTEATKHTPESFTRNKPTQIQETQFNASWWVSFFAPIVIVVLFFLYFV